jgi:hypothetical protein
VVELVAAAVDDDVAATAAAPVGAIAEWIEVEVVVVVVGSFGERQERKRSGPAVLAEVVAAAKGMAVKKCRGSWSGQGMEIGEPGQLGSWEPSGWKEEAAWVVEHFGEQDDSLVRH